ncbi:galactose oxidase [Gigaspora margarita]|uniref:Galactose oxidase n=1 Tax=Gigaspora margarita TaxID=4874 RepID=A0A8H4B395_GIGMA|nr:galactose oxidase [Gigaspora margarita]
MSYFNFYIFIFFLNFIFIFAEFVPPQRLGHASVLVDKKLYIYSGFDGTDYLSDFFYLDVSQNFTMKALPWNDLTFTGIFANIDASMCSGGSNNDLILFSVWTDVRNGGNQPTGRVSFSCAKFSNGSIAIFAGFVNNANDRENDLWIFDSLALTWSLNNAPNAPADFWGYCAITLPDNTILYIGGNFFGINLPLNSLPLFDSTSNTWKNLNTTGPTPLGRHDFSAVLTSGKRIIIFGGYGDTSSLGDLWILDIATYQWSAGTILNPNGLILNGHTANLVDNYMIVAFDKI